MITVSDDDMKTYDDEMKLINKMFPNAQFSIAIDYSIMSELLTKLSKIVILRPYNCHYCNMSKRVDKYVIEKNKSTCMTYKHVISSLIKQGMCLDCDHHFLEGFHKVGEGVFEIVTGS